MSKSILIGLAGAGVVGGVATGSYYLLKSGTTKEESTKITTPKTLLEELAGDDFEALSTDTSKSDDDTHWGKLIEKHISEKTNPKLTLSPQIKTHAGDNVQPNIKAFKNACKTLFEKPSSSEADKSLAKNWCNKKTKLVNLVV